MRCSTCRVSVVALVLYAEVVREVAVDEEGALRVRGDDDRLVEPAEENKISRESE